MSKKVRQADIAKRLGVSIVTVSKALSGKDGVGKDLRKRVIEIAEELGYAPSEAGIERADDKEFNISILVHEQHMSKYGSFYAQINQQISANIMKAGSYPYTEMISGQMLSTMTMPRLIQENKANGIIVIGRLGHEYIRRILELCPVPYVMLDFYEEDLSADYVISDSYYGGYTMTRYLISKGHRKIGYVGTVAATGSIMDRYLGYVKAMRENHLEIREDYCIDDRTVDAGKIFSPDRLKLPEDMPTAFFCNCDITAGTLIKRLNAEGYRVPEDISVVGYDNYIYPGACDIAITTYEVNTSDMAAAASENILKKLNGRYEYSGNHIIEGKLIEKDSVRAL